jgi:hypothetical protein
MESLLLKDSLKRSYVLRASIKKIILKTATFNNKLFVDFISHIQDNFSLDCICFEDIWEDNNGKGFVVLHRVKLLGGYSRWP